MKKILATIDSTVDAISKLAAAFGIAAGVALAFINVVARYVFDSSLTWASELTIYFFVWSTFFGAVYCFKKDAHILVDVLIDRLSPAWNKRVLLFVQLVTLVFLVAVAWYGYKYLLLEIELDERSVDLNVPMWIPYAVIPVAFGLSSYVVARKFFTILYTNANDIIKKSEAEMIVSQMQLDSKKESK